MRKWLQDPNVIGLVAAIAIGGGCIWFAVKPLPTQTQSLVVSKPPAEQRALVESIQQQTAALYAIEKRLALIDRRLEDIGRQVR